MILEEIYQNWLKDKRDISEIYLRCIWSKKEDDGKDDGKDDGEDDGGQSRQCQDSVKTVSRQCQDSAKWFVDSILR
jgi:hypothetical protein